MRLARWLVLTLILFSIGALLMSIALFPASAPVPIASLAPNDNWTATMTQVALDQLGWSPQSLAWFDAVLGLLAAVAWCVIGLIVFRRKSDSWFGLYVAVTFAVLGTSAGAPPLVTAQAAPLLTSWQALTGALAWQFLFILFYLFPDGRFVPAWTRWLLLGWLIGNLASRVAPSLTVPLALLFVGLVISAVASQIYRYVRVSDALQRQQTKWIAFMGGIFLLFIFPQILIFTVLAPTSANLATSFLASTLINTLTAIWLLCLPIAIGIAILRYRLWDIDIIIRRTLVYLPLTAILAGVFAASIRLLQSLFSPVSGQQSGAATALTTLIVVAAFDPIKGWLQRIVDTRFKEVSNPEGRWKAYDEEVRDFVQMIDAVASARRLLEEALAVFDAKDGAIYLQKAGEMQLVHTLGPSHNAPELLIPLEYQGSQLGRLALGARRNARPYGLHDRELLLQTANAVAAAIALVGVKNTSTTGATLSSRADG
jgi:MFS family permease